MNGYNPKEIEPKWQKYWEEQKTFEVLEDSSKKKFYALIEFPYPSGAGLHVGHPRPFTAMDVISRKRRMQDQNVLFPIGFDSFGLPTENYAIKTGRPPAEITAENIATFTRQLKSLGFSFDWSRAVTTSEPEYYKWTQWIFLQLFKHGLAYKKQVPINWCLNCKIGLANEEVVDGRCERCGGPVEKRDKEQWMLAITKYADSLLEGLKEVDYIPQARVQQENWIGRSQGATVQFSVLHSEYRVDAFTTRPDTLFGATYLVVAPEHEIINHQKSKIKNWSDVEKYTEDSKRKTEMERTEVTKEKTGVELQGIRAMNPTTNEEIPIWVADYVLGSYGTGAIMAVPAHDERDFEFAKKYNLPIRQVVAPYLRCGGICEPREDKETRKKNVVSAIVRNPKDDTYAVLKWKHDLCGFIGGAIEENETPKQAIEREIKEESGYTDFTVQYSSIPNFYGHGYKPRKDVNCYDFEYVCIAELNSDTKNSLSEEDEGAHEVVWLKKDDVSKALTLEHHKTFWQWYEDNIHCIPEEGIAMNSDFLNGLETKEAKEKMIQWLEEKEIGKRQVNFKLRDWVFSRQRYWGEPIPLVYCDACAGWIPLPEDQLPLELPKVDKYEPTDTGESPLAAMTDWVKTTCPQCGGPARRETDVMPNWAGSSWYWLRYCDPKNNEQLAAREKLDFWTPVDWYNGGMEHTVLHLLYSRFWNQFLYDIGIVSTREPYAKRTSHGLILAEDGEKMSKSRGNVVNPDEVVDQFGADTLRTYIMFMGPFDQHVAWNTNGLVGVKRFLEKVWRLQEKVQNTNGEQVEKILHQTIKKVSEDIEAMRFNTAVAKLMELVNAMNSEQGAISKEQFEIFLKLLSPFSPHIAEELWNRLGNTSSITYAPWPEFDPAKIVEDIVTIVVQVNGKVRASLEVPVDIFEDDAKAQALQQPNVVKWLERKEPKKVMYVKGKLVSIVV